MNDKLYEQLVRDYPEVFEKKEVDFGVGDGWYSIMDALLECITANLQNSKRALKAAIDYPREDNGKYLNECEASVAKAISEIPAILQVKEKFGGLRFYYNGGNEQVEAYVSMAEAMSYRTCEKCGTYGKLRTSGWAKVLCDKHAGEDENRNGSNPGRVSPQIFED